MSLPLIIIMMLLAGLAGGLINYLLPSNTDATGNKIRKRAASIMMGIGATILVPLFLEIAQSKLMDNIHFGWAMQMKECDCSKPGSDTLNLNVVITDTAKKTRPDSATAKKDTAKIKIPVSTTAVAAAKDCCVPLKTYFLFLAYCLVAAAAGLRFISSIIDSVLKEKQIADLTDKNAKTEAEKEKEKAAKEKAEKEKNKLAAQDMREADETENLMLHKGKVRVSSAQQRLGNVVAIGPITVADDRQKGRFGGSPVSNDRKLSAIVADKPKGMFYDFTLTVESTDKENPLTGEVIFYLHDSFTPNVITKPVIEGKAVYTGIAYGAFTVGAVADDGNTLLELDLAEDKNFPKEFRER
jgi:hypothetical protein